MGTLSEEQAAIVRRLVKNRPVHDLGAGSLDLAIALTTFGAREVIAVDKERMPRGHALIRTIQMSFTRFAEQFKGGIEVAFLSWPENRMDIDLLTLLKRSETVIYLGKNTDGNACGHPMMFEHFQRRKLLAYLPERRNTLAVYGKALVKLREPKGEEQAGLSMYLGPWLNYEHVERR